MMNRPCCRISCSRQAGFTLTFDYEDQLAVIGPLSYAAEPHTYDLCRVHAERLGVPQGWTIMRPVATGADPALDAEAPLAGPGASAAASLGG